jgi:hypothetical protein
MVLLTAVGQVELVSRLPPGFHEIRDGGAKPGVHNSGISSGRSCQGTAGRNQKKSQYEIFFHTKPSGAWRTLILNPEPMFRYYSAIISFFPNFVEKKAENTAILIMAFRSLRGFSGQLLLEPELPKKYPNLFFHPKVY